jgi:hypothetical protein
MTVNANTCEHQLMHGRAWDNYRVGIEEAIKSEPKTFFGYVDLKKKRVCYSSAIHFKDHLASGPDDICILLADFIQRTYADDVWVPSAPDQVSCSMTHLLVLFSSLSIKYRVFCWSWMSAKVRAYFEKLCIRFCASTFFSF